METVFTHQNHWFPGAAKPSIGLLQSEGDTPSPADVASGTQGTVPSTRRYFWGVRGLGYRKEGGTTHVTGPVATDVDVDVDETVSVCVVDDVTVDVDVDVTVGVPTSFGSPSPAPQPMDTEMARKPTNARVERFFMFRSPFLGNSFPPSERGVKILLSVRLI
jgi:hypothetical protein